MPVSRRQFIKLGAGMVTVGVIAPTTLLREARAQSPIGNRKLVIINLEGGNDGLNTVIPYTDSEYHKLRPALGFKEGDLKTPAGQSTIISNQFGLHPAMGEIKAFYDQGKVAIVQGVGYRDSSLSHFLSADIWQSADTSGLSRTGWLGRYADLALINQPGLPAASFNYESPRTFHSRQVVIPNILNFDLYNFLTDPAYPDDYTNQFRAFYAAASRTFPGESLVGAVNRTALASVEGAQRVQAGVASYQSSVIYPEENPLASGLKMVAQVLTTLPEAYLTYAQMGGFDNHSDQILHPDGNPDKREGDHARLLGWFSEAVKVFYDDMAEHGLADQVVMMQYSEFGRRPEENASFGTDHGTSNVMFVIGNPVRGGLYGTQPSLAAADLDDGGNPKFHVDFREVYATILEGWLNFDSREVLGAKYDNVGFFG
jgi:uncharacterized protein (DUF1501 family)